MAIFIKKEMEDLIDLKKHYCRYENPNLNDIIDKYSHLSIRKKFELSQILYHNLITGKYSSQNDCENAEKILTDLLHSITEEDLQSCGIIDDTNLDTIIQYIADEKEPDDREL